MKVFRLATSTAVLAGALWFVTVAPSATPHDGAGARCQAVSLIDSMNLAARQTGGDHVVSLDRFGCAGDFAYAWATVGVVPHEVSVTDVLYWRADLTRWVFVDRAVACNPTLISPAMYRLGCFSN